MQSAVIFNNVRLTHFVCGYFAAVNTSAPWVGLFSGFVLWTRQYQESPVTNFPRWLDNRYDVQGQPGTWGWHPESGFLSWSLLPLLLNARLPRIFPPQQQQNTIRFPCSFLCFTQPDTLPEFVSSYLQQQQKAFKYWNAPRTILHVRSIFDKIVYYRDIYSNMALQTPPKLQCIEIFSCQNGLDKIYLNILKHMYSINDQAAIKTDKCEKEKNRKKLIRDNTIEKSRI